MADLLFSILFTTSLGIFLKLFERWKLNVFEAIVFNYVSCVITGSVVQQNLPQYCRYSTQMWFKDALILGLSFVFFFNVMGFIVKQSGITVMSVANKLSLVIPVAFAFLFYNETVTWLKLAGIGLALVSVVLTSLKNEEKKISITKMFWPLLLFIGSGLNDSLVKYAQSFHIKPVDNAAFNTTIFSVAAIAGLCLLIFFYLSGRFKPGLKSIGWGLMLGVPNYSSMFFLVRALSYPQWGGAVIFSLNNISVVAISALTARILFGEKLSAINLAGLLLAGLAIVAIIFS